MRKLTLAAALAVFTTGAAGAADLKDGPVTRDVFGNPVSARTINWSGVSIGGLVGYGNTNHKLTGEAYRPGYCDEGDATTEADCEGDWIPAKTFASGYLDGLNSHGFFGGVTIGADYQVGRFVFGAFGDYNISAIDTEAGASFGGTPLFSASIEEGDSWLVAGRLGYLIDDRALLYVIGGYGQTDVDYKLNGETVLGKTFPAWVIGVGSEYALTRNVFLAGEYHHYIGAEKTLFDDEGIRIADKVSGDKFMAKLKLKLNGGSRW